MPTRTDTSNRRALDVFRRSGGVLRTREALAKGIHPRTLYRLRDEGVLEQVSRGVYRLAESEPRADPDLLAVAARVPKGVICLISALAIHDLTTQMPHSIDIALPPGSWAPKLRGTPIRIYRFSGRSMTEGIETRRIEGVPLRVFDPEKTLADCFKFRNRIGLDVVVEALQTYRTRRKQDLNALMKYAEIDRVSNVIRPYLEATL